MTKGKRHIAKKYEEYYGEPYIPKTLTEAKRCQRCGKTVDSKARHCPRCGGTLAIIYLKTTCGKG